MELTLAEVKPIIKYIINNNKELQEKGQLPIAVNICGEAGIGKLVQYFTKPIVYVNKYIYLCDIISKYKYMIDNNKLIELNKCGLTQREMAKKLNVSRATIQRALRKLGIHTPNYHNMLKFDNTVFDCIDTEEKAY